METPNNNPTVNVESWPKVRAGNQTLEVKWGFFSRFLLSSWGIALEGILGEMRGLTLVSPEVKGDDGTVTAAAVWRAQPGYTARMTEMFAACVGHNYTKLGQPAPDAMYWAERIEEEQWADILTAIVGAMGKEQAAKQKRLALAPLQQENQEPVLTTPIQ